MMDNVHKHNICTNVPLSQTFRSYLAKLMIRHSIFNIAKALANKIQYLHIASIFILIQLRKLMYLNCIHKLVNTTENTTGTFIKIGLPNMRFIPLHTQVRVQKHILHIIQSKNALKQQSIHHHYYSKY
jgi:hypothetical protein